MSDRPPAGWRRVTLGEVAREREERAECAPHAAVYSVTKHNGFVPSLQYFGRQVFSSDTANYRVVRRGDLAYATIHLDEGSLGLFDAADAGLISPMYTVLVVTDASVDAKILFALLKRPAMIGQVGRLGAGSVHRRKSILFSVLSRTELDVPPPVEQRAIAAILDAFDEAIERTATAIAATESLRRALMHELLTRGLPGWHTNWRQVPGIGTVPACWEASTLGSIVREPIRNGQSMVAPSSDTGRWQLTLGAVTFSGLDHTAIKPAPADNRPGALLEVGDLLISRSNTRERVGLAGIYRGVPDACTYPDLLMRVRLDRRVVLTEFVEAVLLSPQGRDYFERQARGTSGSMVKITGGIAAAFPFARPGLAEQQGIVDTARGVTRALGASAQHLATLRALKSATSEALLTGHLRAKDTTRPAVIT